jgi:hypothetical protein
MDRFETKEMFVCLFLSRDGIVDAVNRLFNFSLDVGAEVGKRNFVFVTRWWS